jgi:protease I
MEALRKAGAKVTVLAPKPEHTTEGVLDHVTAKLPEHLRPSDRLQADATIASASAGDFDGLLIPGGYAPEALRMVPEAIAFVRAIYAAGKPIAGICHAAQLLISAEVVRGKNMTCVPTVGVDLRNAGAIYLDEPVVVDGQMVTSRTPADMSPFIEATLAAMIR